MYLSFKELEKELLRNFYIEGYHLEGNQMINNFELFKVDKKGKFDVPKPNTLYICEYRQLRFLDAFTRFDSPLLCVLSDNDYLDETLIAHKPILLIHDASVEELTLFLAKLMYRYGQKSSDILEISELFLRCKSLDDLLDKAYQVLGYPIVITDDAQRILSMTSPALTRNPAYRQILDMDYLPVGHPDAPLSKISPFSEDFPSVYLGDDARPSIVCKELLVGGSLKGYLHILAFDHKIKEDDLYLIELLCNLAASHFIEYKNTIRADRNDMKARYFRNILNHKCGNPDQILEQQKKLALSFDQYIYTLIIMFKRDADSKRISFPDLGRQLADRLPKGHSFIHRNTLFLLFSLDDIRKDLTPIFEDILPTLEEYGLVMGVSYPGKSIIHLRSQASQALSALQIGSGLDRNQSIFFYRDFSIYRMLEISAESDSLRNFVLPQFNLLREHCSKNGDSLLTTVRVYLESQCNKSKTAEKLFTHPNTIKYRLSQAEEIMGLKLDDPENILNLMLSFKILNYARHFPPGDPRKEKK